MNRKKPTYEELQNKLKETEALIASLRNVKTDAAAGEHDSALMDSREIEEAYIESEQNFRNSMDASPLGIRIVTAEGELIYANQAILDICGYATVEDLKAVPHQKLYTPESYTAHLERIEKRRHGVSVPSEYEIGIRRSDGEVRHLQVFRREVNWGGERQFMAMYQDITERKRAEEALRESEEKYHSLVEHGNDGIVFIQDARVVYLNSKMLEMLGYSVEEVYSQPFSNFVAPEQRELLLERYKKRMAGEEVPARYESVLIAKDGRKIDVEISASTFQFKGKLADLAIIRDITERKWAEDILKKQQLFLSDVLASIQDGISILDKEYHIISVNQALQKWYAHAMPLVGKKCYEAYHSRSELCEVCPTRRTFETGKAAYDVVPRGGPGGEIIGWLDLFSFPLINTQTGETTGVIEYVRDITDRKRAEEALKESQEMFSKAFQQSPSLILITTLDGRILEANDAYCRVSGYSREEIIGNTTLKLNLWYDPEQRKAILQKLQEKGEVTNEEVQFRTKKGGVQVVFLSMAKVTLKNEPCLLSIAVDVTDRKRAEKALKESEERWFNIFNDSPIGIGISTPEGKVVIANDIMQTFTGYSLDELKKINLGDIYKNPEDRKRLLNIVDRDGKATNFTTQLKRKDGTTFDVLLNTLRTRLKGEDVLQTSLIDITDRRRAEEALKESEEKFRSLFETMAQGVVYQDASGKIISANPAAEGILGLTFGQMQGRTSLDPRWKALHEDGSDFPGDQHPAMLALRTARPINDVVMGIFNPFLEEYRWILVSAVPEFREGQDFPYQVYTTFTDITDRRKLEEELARQHQESKLIIDASPILVFYKDKEGKFLRVNKALAEALNMPAEQFIGKTVFDLYSAEIAQGMTNDDREVIESGRPKLNIIEQYESAIGLRWVQTDKVPIFDKKGLPVGLIGFAQDITERKLAEERINHLNLSLHSIRNVSQLITREKNRDKLIQGICDSLVESHSFDCAWVVLFGDSLKPVAWASANIGTRFSDLVNSLQQSELPRCVQKAIKQKQVVITELPHNCEGCPLLFEPAGVGSMTIRLEIEGTIYGVLCASMPRRALLDKEEIALFKEVATDIAFALHNIELGSANELLQQERLRAAKLESIGTLAGGIAHDFNNLLTGIMGNIGLAKTYIQPSDTTFDMLDEAEKAAIRARDLTQQLLTFARGGKPVKNPVNVARLLKEAATFALRGSKVKLELSLPDDLWSIEADEGQISQVINNLVINADEAMPSGGILKIDASNYPLKRSGNLPLSNRNYVRIDIKDTGIGIPPEHLQRIFEPYFTTKQKGSGLGLTSAYSIVRNHGGGIFAESTLNEGSTFQIYLPASKKTLKGGRKVAIDSSGQAGGKVLVMDDEETIRKMLKNMLSLAGYQVELSTDGAEALEKYTQALQSRDPFSAVIMDLTIPGGMGGKEAIKKLLEIDPDAKVIVSSGYATDSIMSEYKKYGFKAVIAKPYSVKQLQETLSSLPRRKKK